MISITVCDDDPLEIETLKKYSEQYQKDCTSLLEWHFLMDPARMEPEALSKADILILDIQMGSLNGIELAKKVRQYNEKEIILFSTNYLEYALQGYEVEAFRYLKKPIAYGEFAKAMNDTLAKYHRSAQAFIVLRCGYLTEQFRIENIMYCETESGHTKVTLADQPPALANTGISELEKRLSEYSFFRCHKAYLVNLKYVKQPQKTDVRMKNGVLIPVSKHRMKEFMVALMRYWGELLR